MTDYIRNGLRKAGRYVTAGLSVPLVVAGLNSAIPNFAYAAKATEGSSFVSENLAGDEITYTFKEGRWTYGNGTVSDNQNYVQGRWDKQGKLEEKASEKSEPAVPKVEKPLTLYGVNPKTLKGVQEAVKKQKESKIKQADAYFAGLSVGKNNTSIILGLDARDSRMSYSFILGKSRDENPRVVDTPVGVTGHKFHGQEQTVNLSNVGLFAAYRFKPRNNWEIPVGAGIINYSGTKKTLEQITDANDNVFSQDGNSESVNHTGLGINVGVRYNMGKFFLEIEGGYNQFTNTNVGVVGGAHF